MMKNKLILEFNKFINYDEQSEYIIVYENPLFIHDDNQNIYELEDFDTKDVDCMMNELINDFNENSLVDYIDDSDIENSFRIKSITATIYNVKNNTFNIEVRIKGEPSEDDIVEIMDYIEGQCSDGWGENFEQTEITCKNKSYFISAWSIKDKEKKIKFIKKEKINI